ncbi:LysM peptidoglycan-binding domain-containing protein [Litorimonas sp. RW-G-Af-16]|uniref:lytic transglycosylase n=1 Tax=Litorimonas sp. RW-G-Af-16 TaxID=3241168 RepID=UPI00390C909D
MRSAILLSATMLVAIAGSASAQTAADDDRFKPRVYGSLGVTPAYQGGTVELYQPESETDTSTVTRVVEPVEPSVTTLINAPVTYTETGVVKAQHFKQGDLSETEYQALLNEADRVRAYQGTSATTASSTISPAYEIQLYETAPTTTTVTEPVQSAAISTAHSVAKGDTLYNISKRYGTTVAALQDANGLSGTAISLGQTLTIPGNAIPQQSLNTTMAQPIFASAPVQQGYVTRRVVQPVSTSPNSSVYAVLKKDTLYSISRRTCVSVGDLISTNSLSNPNALTPGQRLTLPSGHCLTK